MVCLVLLSGFTSKRPSQVNKNIWFNSLLNYYINSAQPEFKPVFNSNIPEQNSIDFSNKNFKSSSKSFRISFDDSTTIKDSTLVPVTPDTLTQKKDTIKVDPLKIDSTARVQHFRYKRKDKPHISLYEPRESKFFVQPSQNLKRRTIGFDSTGKNVVIKEMIGDQVSKYILSIPIEEYIELRIKTRQQEMWDELAYKYELKDTSKRGLSELMKDITNLEIPLPSIGLLSIFGTPKISLSISGAVDIHGAWRNETTEGITTSLLGNTRNEPDFRQQVQVNVNGTIGDKLQINADWNTERTFEYENQLKIKYTGYEDEIIQNVEAGNVSIQTSPLIGGGEALFGVKAQFKMGPLSLTTLASQKKGEIKEKSVTGGATSQDYDIRAYEYSTNHYFIDTIYASQDPNLNLFNNFYGQPTPAYDSRYYVQDIQVWRSITQYTTNPSERNANVFVDLPSRRRNQNYGDTLRNNNVQPKPGEIEVGRFILLTEGTDYIIHRETGFISFKTSLNTNDVIGVAYFRVAGIGDTLYYGDFVGYGAGSDTSQRLVLKLIKPQNLQPSHKTAWKLQLKNIYPVGGRNIKKDGFTFDIKYEIEGQDAQNVLGNVKLLNAFGLDLQDASGGSQPDGLFDFRDQLTIMSETGEIIFPVLEPFGRNLPQALNSLPNYDSLKYNDVYDTSVTFAKNNKVRDKWIMVGKFSGESSSIYQLGFNLVENSVRVTLNGRELTPGVDYYMDYNIGQLTIRNDAALVPGANLKISYEENDLFQLASKTLLGLRGELDISKRTKLGFTALNLTQQTLSDKVRIGEEPLSNSIYGMDFSTSADLPFLTRGLDYLISTREMSSVSFRGEFAYMNPDPNTKKSTIASDKGNSIAYIDDFEGSKRTIPVGVGYTSWKDVSVPDSLNTLSPIAKLPDSLTMNYKGNSWWYSILPANVPIKDIWPEKRVAKGEDQITTLDYVFVPSETGSYNYSDTTIKNLPSKKAVWGGIMKMLSSTANNLVDENIEFIEFWLNKRQVERGAKIYIDLGRISEKLIYTALIPTPKGRSFHTEDKNGNDLIDQGEDVGVDGLTNAEEQAIFGASRPDPSKDNFSFTRSGSSNPDDYRNINGSEGNAALTDVGRLPDTEDLNRNSYLDTWRDYFRYEVALDTVDQFGNQNPFIAGGGNKGWYLYRIPLKEFKTKIGSPSLTQVEMIRLFVTNLDTSMHISIAEFNLVGSQWQNAKANDSTLQISVINIEDNPNYTSPPGVQREKDRSRPDQDILRNEQALNLILTDLPYGESREAVKYLYKPLDVFSYSEMKLFVHCDRNTEGLDYFFRFGADTNNFYEYRNKLKLSSDPTANDWTEIQIIFNKITAIKQNRAINSTDTIINFGNYSFRVKGQPSLTNIKFLSMGMFNYKDSLMRSVSGEVWVNELRVIGADDTPGWSYSIAASIKLADLMNISFNLSKQDPYFHRLSDRFGNRTDSKSWGIASDIDILKLLPFNMSGSVLRLNYSHNEGISNPLYLPGTDIRVDEAAKNSRDPEKIIREAQTMTISDSWSTSGVKLLIPTDYWLIRDTWNSLVFGFNYNKTYSRSPTVESQRSWIWNASVSYGINLSPDYSLYLADIPLIGTIISFLDDYRNVKIYYSPQAFSWNMNAKRNRGINVSRATNNALSQTTISREFSAGRGLSLAWKLSENGLLNISTTYTINVQSSLTYLETDVYNNQRPESHIWWDIFKSGLFGRDFGYTQSVDIRTSPKLPTLWDINKFFTLNGGYSVNYQWANDFRQEELGRSAGYSSKSSIGLNLRLKSLFEPLFPQIVEEEVPVVIEEKKEKERERKIEEQKQPFQPVLDSTGVQLTEGENIPVSDSTSIDSSANVKPKKSPLKNVLVFLRNTAKFLIFDYENISINFSSDNTLSSTGLYGSGTGFRNFWGIKTVTENGPPRAFQFGLSSNVGKRAIKENANLQDVFSQRNGIDFKTSRTLWEGVKVDLNWKVGWSMNRSTSLKVNPDGTTSISNITSSGTIDRSFLTLPPFLIFSVFKSGIKRVNELYDPKASNPNQSLSNAFVNGFETFPWLGKLGFLKEVSKYIPRPNWRLTYDGLEKFFIFKSFAQRVSLDHSYSSGYSEGWKLNTDGTKLIQSQKISYGFSPLIGLNMTFNQLWEGNFSGSIKYNVTNNFDLGTTTKNITEGFSRDIGITINYSKTGFEIPLFGLALKNDIEFSFTYSNTKSSQVIYDMDNFKEEGTPQDGTTRTTLEPRIKYVISSRVTLSIFYRRTSVSPEGAARISPSTTNEAGLDIRISIQG